MGSGESALPLIPSILFRPARRPPEGWTPRAVSARLAGAALAALWFAAAAFLPGVARSAEAIYLSWEDCRTSSGGVTNQAFNCDENTQSLQMIVAFETPVDLGATVIGLEAVVDVQHESPVLPDWWTMGASGCRSGRLLASADFTSFSGCADPWAGSAGAAVQGFDIGQPRGQPNQVRIKAVAGVLPKAAVTLSSGITYYALRLRIQTTLTTGSDACTGCISGACLVLNGITIRRSAGGDLLLTQPGLGDGNRVTWRSGGSADCQAVPTRAVTWGSIKALYR